MDDLISRKDAIDTFKDCAENGVDINGIVDALENLPSAEPEITADGDTISRRALMKEFQDFVRASNNSDFAQTPTWNDAVSLVGSMPSAQPETHDKRTETHACDLINRQQAIDAVVSAMIDGADAELVEGVMELLPSAQPQRKKGRWIWWYEEEFTEHATEYTPHCKCSECGRECAPSVATFSNFCRNCGADMRGESE